MYINHEFGITFPCDFENKDGQNREMTSVFLIYNHSMIENSPITSFALSMSKDVQVLAFKNEIDNAILEYKAKTLGYKPEDIP